MVAAISGLFTRPGMIRKPVPAMNVAVVKALPVDHIVTKDGKPFAILNATPELAQRTLDGFVRATPGARWALARC